MRKSYLYLRFVEPVKEETQIEEAVFEPEGSEVPSVSKKKRKKSKHQKLRMLLRLLLRS